MDRSRLLEVCRALAKFGESGHHVLEHAETISGSKNRARYLAKAFRFMGRQARMGFQWKRLPVDARTFFESPHYLGQQGIIYPVVLQEAEELNNGHYLEAVLTGGIGSGKSSLAIYTQAYQLYLLSCLKHPQKQFGLAPSSEIMIVFQSATLKLAETVDYARFKELIDSSPYFKQHFPYDKARKSEMHFPHRIMVRPLSGATGAALGQNVIGGILDEMSFMQLIEGSSKAADGGTFNQAVELYNAITRRRKSRFMRRGWMPGIVCLVSSKRYPGEFVEVKAEEAKRERIERGETTIFVYDKRIWEVKPEGTYTGRWFRLFIGDVSRKPEILDDDSVVPDTDRHLVMLVPEEFRSEFENDILSALRDIAGVATRAVHPYVLEPERVTRCFGTTLSILSREDCDFRLNWPMVHPKRILNPEEPRYAHVDLALTGDSAGLAIGHIERFVEVERGSSSVSECLPVIRFDLLLQVKPPPNSEIQFEKVRQLLYRLRELGLNLKWLSADSFQSADFLQLMASQGVITGKLSMDTSNIPYDVAKQAFYDGRVLAPTHARCQMEWTRLERDPRTGKVDHPSNASKDVSDASAGVIHGLTMRRELWARHNVPIVRLPKSLQEVMAKEAARAQRAEERARVLTGDKINEMFAQAAHT